jgi:FMN phosphatase YigB (HAD superfamily)
MKGTVIFDFDDTLADTVSFKGALAKASRRDDVVTRMADFVFPQAKQVLGRLKEQGWKLALLTYGDPGWQRRKLAYTGLLPFFDFVLFTAEPKETKVAEFRAWPGPLVFVNDHGGELDALKKLLPDARLIGVRGPKAACADPDVPLCGSLEEVYKTVSLM